MLRAAMLKLREFLRREDGSIAVEAILMFPMLSWCYLATFVYFDGFRAQATTLKAAYTISDALSRETDPITNNYLTAAYRLHLFLTSSNYPTKLQVSEIVFDRNAADDADDDAHRGTFKVVWTQTRGGADPLDDATLKAMRDSIPTLPDGGKTILVQSWVIYEPVFSVGLEAFTFHNFVFTPPRFAQQLCWSTVNSNWTSANLTC